VAGDALRAWFFLFFRGGMIAALPFIAVDQEYVFCVEVVIVKLADYFLLIL
jgi:hypothetical protein